VLKAQANESGPRRLSLQDKWRKTSGRIFISGTQALIRVLLLRKWLDEGQGLKSAGFISGYRGSPLGHVDLNLWSIADQLKAADIRFEPGVNEDMAATAVRGTQQIDAVPNPRYDGVFAAWYGKGPGVDRSGDALKHGNFKGTHRNGGVLVFYGDDHAGKSSTVAHHSEQALAAAFIPSLYPADVGEILSYGLLGFAMSRFSGSWIGIKCVNEIVEQTASVDLAFLDTPLAIPPVGTLPPEGVHCREGVYAPLRDEQIVVEHRLPLVQAFVRANRIDRTVIASATPRLGLVTAGKSYGDTRQALALLGLSDQRAAELGISLYKVGCIWPLEPKMATAFCSKQELIFVIEEKKSVLEPQLASILYNLTDRPRLIGKADESDAPLLSRTLPLEPIQIALAIADALARLGIDAPDIDRARAALAEHVDAAAPAGMLPRRLPYYCSGCPHSRSTRIPEGSLAMTGIGCHSMAVWARPAESLHATHMGGEGGNWIGLAPFTDTPHIFQNLGDGTYYHSGLLAIRAAVAAGVNITYKILYNDAVAMTGGQPVDGPISVAQIAQQVRSEGVETIVIVSDDPARHEANPAIPTRVRIAHRTELDGIQRELRETPGCTILIYEQTCAAEKRRRRKKGQFPDPPKRLFIASAVCEGCGDCSVQSTCVSLMPRETEFGVKRRIDQSNCNKDYSCQEGFCPSFITVSGAEPRKPARAEFDEALFDSLPLPSRKGDRDRANIMIVGVGGTGVITVAAVIAMAAHLDGLAASTFDMTGLAQKNGAVFSHVRIAPTLGDIHAQRIGRGEADLLLAFDVVGAAVDDVFLALAPERTFAVVSTDVAPTMAFQFDRDAYIQSGPFLEKLQTRLSRENVETIQATSLATALLGDPIAANFFMIGYALQKGLLPIDPEALEKAITLNGNAVAFNLDALRLGRLFVTAPERILSLARFDVPAPSLDSLDALVAHREEHLSRYQDAAYAARYRRLVDRIRDVERQTVGNQEGLGRTVATNFAKLLAYKDEYEVARLLTDRDLQREIEQAFEPGARLSFNLAPPALGGKSIDGRPRKRAFDARWMHPLLSVLAHARKVRGTWLDPFGHSAERRMERALIGDYEELVWSVLDRLTPLNHGAAVDLLGLASSIRGFGPVKQKAVDEYRVALTAAREKFDSAASHALTSGQE
jgi:indolepyruvate ferredoxin oxidoreductase